MLFIPENADDISRYYRNTFVKFRETGETLFYIQNVNCDKVTGTAADGTPFELLLDQAHPYEVDYLLPRKSFFQYGVHACLLQRIPAKQYQRGVSESNTTITRLATNKETLSFGFELLTSFVGKQAFPKLLSVIGDKSKVSVALSPRLAYISASRQIYADLTKIGQVKMKERTIQCPYPIFKPELEALVQGTPYKVVI